MRALLHLLTALYSSVREVPEPWDFSDGAGGEMGLNSRGLFAVELMSLDYHLVTWKVHYHAMPAISALRDAGKLLSAAAVQLRLPASATRSQRASSHRAERHEGGHGGH